MKAIIDLIVDFGLRWQWRLISTPQIRSQIMAKPFFLHLDWTPFYKSTSLEFYIFFKFKMLNFLSNLWVDSLHMTFFFISICKYSREKRVIKDIFCFDLLFNIKILVLISLENLLYRWNIIGRKTTFLFFFSNSKS